MKAHDNEGDASEILRTVPPHQSFFFFEGTGKYTGKMATNLADFCENIKAVDVKSVTFHFERGDYEKWIREILHDAELAQNLKGIKKSGSGEELRNKILQAARKRLNELQKGLHRKAHTHGQSSKKAPS